MCAVDVIVIAGSPGSGKSALMDALAASLPGWPPRIEFSDLREWHLDRLWERQSETEEAVAFENVLFVIDNYLRHGMTPVLVTDFREHRISDLVERYGTKVLLVTLFAPAAAIRDRIDARHDGFTNVAAAVEWNKREMERPLRQGEQRFDTSAASTASIVETLMQVL